MIRDLMQQQPERGRRTDVCIVGAGAAGIAVAVELARLGRSVTLLEGGGRDVELAAQSPYASESAALAHRGLHGGRVRALGGTTTRWGGQILELDALDFERRPWVAESGWPFAKSELTRHYARALELEGLTGAELRDHAVWSALKQPEPAFAPLCTYLSRWCPEPNFAVIHGAALAGEKIEVWLHANAVELLLEGEQATGVRARTQSGAEAVFQADEYIFCLGAIESSRFFLQPRRGTLPWNRSGLLGQHFQDHIDCTAASVQPLSSRAFHACFDAIFLGGYKYNPKLKLSAATQQQHHLLHAGATFFSAAGMDEELTAMKSTARRLLRERGAGLRASEAWQLLRHSPSLVRHSYRYAVQHRAYHPPGSPLMMRVHCEQDPASASTISLSGERDELGLLRTRMSWHVAGKELETIRSFVKIAQRALRGIARILPDPYLMESGKDSLSTCEDSFHHMGGMRMHISARDGVVDPELRLHGTANVFVCSSAVFPTSGFSNPTHTLLALSTRLAERLAKSAGPAEVLSLAQL